jgi:ParB-like chromosome segregation protein Spo0J
MNSKSKLKIEYLPISELKLATYNPRKHTPEAMAELKKSLERFDMVDPIIVNSAPKRKNIVIGGHMRVKALREMKVTEVPVVYVNIPELAKEKELNVRLNKNTGEFDWQKLADFGEDFLKDVGFSSEEIDTVFPEDETPEMFDLKKELDKLNIKEVLAKKGDIYEIDGSRLMCFWGQQKLTWY